MPELIVPLLEWSKQWLMALHPTSLFVLSFLESIFFPVPPDVVLLPLSALRPELALFYAFLTTAGSVSGAVVGYWLGAWGGRPALARFAAPERISQVEGLLSRYDVWAIGIAGFTPVPYKVFAITAGVFRLSLSRFVLISLLSRGARFSLEAALVMWYGETMITFLSAHFEWFTLALAGAIGVVYSIAFRRRRRRAA